MLSDKLPKNKPRHAFALVIQVLSFYVAVVWLRQVKIELMLRCHKVWHVFTKLTLNLSQLHATVS